MCSSASSACCAESAVVDRRPGRFENLPDQRQRIAVVVDRQDANALEAAARRSACRAAASADARVLRPRAGACAMRSGSSIRKVAPFPGPSLSAKIRPPWSSTRCRVIARPRPSPPRSRLMPASACRKRSKTCGRNSGRNAGPGIADRDLDVRIDPLEAHLDPAVPRRELDGIRQHVPQHLLEPLGIARHRRGAGIDDRDEPDALGIGRRPHRFHRVLDHRRQLHRLHVQAELARDDARDVEHILDDLGQRRDVPRHRVQGAGRASRRSAGPIAASGRSRQSRSAASAAHARASPGTRP